MEESYNRKWRYLSSYTEQKRKLRRLRRQREEYLVLRGKTNDLGTVIQAGHTSDVTAESAMYMFDNMDKIERKIREVYESLAAIADYIERSPITETEKLILTCRFIRSMKPEDICEEIDEDACARAAMQKRIKRIVKKLPEPKSKKRL